MDRLSERGPDRSVEPADTDGSSMAEGFQEHGRGFLRSVPQPLGLDLDPAAP